jgi:hypothetical protein
VVYRLFLESDAMTIVKAPLSVFDESPGSEHGFCSALGVWAQAGPTAAKVSASINPHRVMIAFTSEQRMPQQTSSWLAKLSREAVSTIETARDGTRKAIFAVGKRNFPGQRQRPRNAPRNPIGRLQRQNTCTNRRKFGAIRAQPRNLCLCKTAWWGWEMSHVGLDQILT